MFGVEWETDEPFAAQPGLLLDRRGQPAQA
jgi:hypothetical protein